MDNDTPNQPPKNKGQFTKNDPRIYKAGPARRTKDGRTVTSMAREYTEEALNYLVDTMRDESINRKVRNEAVKELLNRAWGAASQQITIEGQMNHNTTNTIDVYSLPAHALEAVVAAQNALFNQNTIMVEPVSVDYIPTDEGEDDN
jgi:hypothetical protein